MCGLTQKDHQIFYLNNKPAFVIVPYDEYQKLFNPEDFFPPEVLKKHLIEGKTLIKAWREYKGISQQDLCSILLLNQSVVSQMENNDKKCRPKTREKMALAIGIEPDQLSYQKLDEFLKNKR